MNDEEKIKELKNKILQKQYLRLNLDLEIEKTKEELKNYLKSRRVKISCCGKDLGKGKNICGYKSDYRCWEYKCPICDNKYYLYDYAEYDYAEYENRGLNES